VTPESTIDRLIVLWGDSCGNRRVVGHLIRTPQVVRFWYDAQATDAKAHGFVPLPGLPDVATHQDEAHAYEARYLFAPFAERIPSKARFDAGELLRSWGVERSDDQFEILARSGGIRATDRLELAEYRAPDDDLSRPLEFRVASRRHLPDAASVAVGDAVSLRREPANVADPEAVIIDRVGRTVGYVPRQYSALVSRILDRNTDIDARVVRELVLPDVGKWVVRLSRPVR
jgi:hypothetical protein